MFKVFGSMFIWVIGLLISVLDFASVTLALKHDLESILSSLIIQKSFHQTPIISSLNNW